MSIFTCWPIFLPIFTDAPLLFDPADPPACIGTDAHAPPCGKDVTTIFAHAFLSALAAGNADWASCQAIDTLLDAKVRMVAVDGSVHDGKTAVVRRLNQVGMRAWRLPVLCMGSSRSWASCDGGITSCRAITLPGGCLCWLSETRHCLLSFHDCVLLWLLVVHLALFAWSLNTKCAWWRWKAPCMTAAQQWCSG